MPVPSRPPSQTSQDIFLRTVTCPRHSTNSPCANMILSWTVRPPVSRTVTVLPPRSKRTPTTSRGVGLPGNPNVEPSRPVPLPLPPVPSTIAELAPPLHRTMTPPLSSPGRSRNYPDGLFKITRICFSASFHLRSREMMQNSICYGR
jgi:hypothetical protein